MIVDDAEGASGVEREVAAPVGCFQFRRKARKRQTLFDMADATSKPPRNVVGGRARLRQSGKGVDFIHRVHGDALNVLDKRGFAGILRFQDVARNREVLGDGAGLRERLQRRKASCACHDFIAVLPGWDDVQVLQQTMCGDGCRQGVDVRLAIGLARIEAA